MHCLSRQSRSKPKEPWWTFVCRWTSPIPCLCLYCLHTLDTVSSSFHFLKAILSWRTPVVRNSECSTLQVKHYHRDCVSLSYNTLHDRVYLVNRKGWTRESGNTVAAVGMSVSIRLWELILLTGFYSFSCRSNVWDLRPESYPCTWYAF